MYRTGSLSLASLILLGAAVAAWPAHRETPFRPSAYGPFTIKVEIEGVTQGVFQTVEGLSSASEVVGSQEDGQPAEIPGPVKGARLILKRPYDPLLSGLWRWRQSIIDGNPQKRDGHIFVFTANGELAAHWVFRKGWPCRWEVPLLAAGASEPAEEVVEIVHTGLTLESLPGS